MKVSIPKCEWCGAPMASLCKVCDKYTCPECVKYPSPDECIHKPYKEWSSITDEWTVRPYE